ncbi:MAG: hypothetical protein HYR76_00990 [Ignavibacteria bacterium]|nr:hypothetical protein [Ignavibacteria bacterium]
MNRRCHIIKRTGVEPAASNPMTHNVARAKPASYIESQVLDMDLLIDSIL